MEASMWKYKVGQRVEILPASVRDPEIRALFGLVTTIIGLIPQSQYRLEVTNTRGVHLISKEHALRPIDDPAAGSWDTISTLLGTDIRRLRETVL